MRILTALDRFVRTGEGDVKALQGRDELRLPVADYRLFFVNIADASKSAASSTAAKLTDNLENNKPMSGGGGYPPLQRPSRLSAALR